MDKAAFIVSLVALIIASMNLSLSVINFRMKKGKGWLLWNIVLCAALLGMAVFYVFALMSHFLYSGTTAQVVNWIFMILFVADTAFVMVFLCHFINWMIARPMSRLAMVLTFLVGLLYLGSAAVNLFVDFGLFNRIETLFPAINVAYCLIVLMTSLSTIKERLVRILAQTFSILTFCMLPLLIFSCFFLQFRTLTMSIVCLAYFIMHLDFMFVFFVKNSKDETVKKALSLSDLAIYHITEREFEVINLIKKGLTNKEIAFELKISVNTVNNHIANIFQKTGVKSRIDLLNVIQETSW